MLVRILKIKSKFKKNFFYKLLKKAFSLTRKNLWLTPTELYANYIFKSYRKVIYTALIDGYDHLREPSKITPGWDYVCFTNNPQLKSKKWKIIYINNAEKLDSFRLNRKIKILYHKYLPNYDISIYIDSNIIIKTNLNRFLAGKLKKNSEIAMMWHQFRKNVYEEAEECIRLNRDDKNTIRQQVKEYKMEGLPNNTGLTENRIIIRKHGSERLKRFMELWWHEILTKSRRDQISFNYLLWKYPLKINIYNPKKFYNSFIVTRHGQIKKKLSS